MRNYMKVIRQARQAVGHPAKGVVDDNLNFDPNHKIDLTEYPLLRKAVAERNAAVGDVYISEEDSDFIVGEEEEEEESSDDTVLEEEGDEVSELPEEPEYSGRSSESSRAPSKVRTDRTHPKKHPPKSSSSESNGSSQESHKDYNIEEQRKREKRLRQQKIQELKDKTELEEESEDSVYADEAAEVEQEPEEQEEEEEEDDKPKIMKTFSGDLILKRGHVTRFFSGYTFGQAEQRRAEVEMLHEKLEMRKDILYQRQEMLTGLRPPRTYERKDIINAIKKYLARFPGKNRNMRYWFQGLYPQETPFPKSQTHMERDCDRNIPVTMWGSVIVNLLHLDNYRDPAQVKMARLAIRREVVTRRKTERLMRESGTLDQSNLMTQRQFQAKRSRRI